MKTRIITVALAVLALSCAQEINTDINPEANKVTISVSIPEEPLSRVSLTEAADHKSIALAWEDGDVISVNGESFTIKDGFTAHHAAFEGNEPSGADYTIIYPGTYTSAEAFGARSYTAQSQTGNSSTGHLEYNAMLAGVDEYAEPCFDAEWAEEKGGSLVQNGVLQLRLQLPAEAEDATSVSLVASRDLFPTTNAGGTLTDELTLSLSGITLPANKILEAYLMYSAAGVTFQAEDVLAVLVQTSAGNYVRTIVPGAQTWAGGSQYTIQMKVQDVNSFDIETVDDLLEFRDGVNSGSIIWQTVYATLKNNLDLSSVSSWTPIGNGTFVTASNGGSIDSMSGAVFKGTFDGNGKALQNLVMTASPAAGEPFGFFGILKGATVKNLTFGAVSGDTGAFTVTPVGMMDAGVIAGVSYGATIQDVTNYIPVTLANSTSTVRASIGLVGYVYGDAASGRSTLSRLVNRGSVTAAQGSNTGNGATGFCVGGIAGFGQTGSTSVINLIEDCVNWGNMESGTGRTAGVLGAANSRTCMDGCENRGNILNTFTGSGGARIAGVCVILGTGASMTDCSNYGNVVVTNSSTHVGGLACLLSNNNVVVSGGGNHGLIVGDITTYRGTLIANINTFNLVSGLVAGGAVASYNSGEYGYVVLTESNYMSYIGKIKAGMEANVTDITFEAWDGYPESGVIKISNSAELLDFAESVRNGEISSTDVVKLIADIDCSDITDWAPIGTCSMTTWTATSLATSGNLFQGTFDGQGHTISNLDMSFSNSSSWNGYGFFAGIDDGATVKNLTFDSTCSMNVSASFGGAFGVLAGVVKGATVENVTSYASITGGGVSGLPSNAANGRTVVGGLVGLAMSTGVNSSLSELYNYGNIGVSETEIFSNGGNVGNGANGFMVGGLVGFASTNGASCSVTISDSENHGNIFSNAGRASGITSSANQYVMLTDCVNYGNNYSTLSGTFRLANITCIAGPGSVLTRCVNRGNLIAPSVVSVAGVVCLVNNQTVQLNACGSVGASIVGSAVNTAGNQTYNGVLFGYCNHAASFSDCYVSGKIGTSLDNLVTLTAGNYFQFVGQATANAINVTTDNITFATE
ncbi:MAG: hypothetical protein J5764_01575 [Bacteroidales bacterium]|nr:hypothetical protein [Bacteroidales bacterium]